MVQPIEVGKFKSFADFQQEAKKNNLADALTMAQVSKAMQPNIEEMGQQAFLKASQGIPLAPQETAALQYLDSKSQTVGFNPVTGALEQKPGLLDRAGISAGNQTGQSKPLSPNFVAAMGGAPQTGSGDFLEDVAPVDNSTNWDAKFKKQYDSLAANPRAQQELLTNYNKQKLLPNEEQAKNAGYATRMEISNPILSSPELTKASTNNVDARIDANLPDWAANRIVSSDYQGAKQAQLDFLNAILRRESGAAISTGEYKNYAKQYFPQPGDSEDTITQKAQNRQAALVAVKTGAGPSYASPQITPIIKQSISDKEKAARALASPAELSAFKKKYGIK